MEDRIGAYRILVGKHIVKRQLGNVGVDGGGGIISKLVFKKCDGVGGINWIDLARDRDRWRAFVSVVMNLRFQ
jgi:hypothetical protein